MKIGFFGCGNMGKALALGIKKCNPSASLYFYTPSKVKAQELAQKTDGHFVDELVAMPANLDWYILGFKPQSLADFNFPFNPSAKILSVLAGVSVETLVHKFSIEKIARLMPNTPSIIGMGANLFFAPNVFLPSELQKMTDLLHSLGKLFVVHSEKEIDLLTPFSGSGPALVFELAHIFEATLNKMTGGHSLAREIVAQTFLGSAELLNRSENSFEELRMQVTSHKGVTYEALKVLNESEIEKKYHNAFVACYNRVNELRKEIEDKNA